MKHNQTEVVGREMKGEERVEGEGGGKKPYSTELDKREVGHSSCTRVLLKSVDAADR